MNTEPSPSAVPKHQRPRLRQLGRASAFGTILAPAITPYKHTVSRMSSGAGVYMTGAIGPKSPVISSSQLTEHSFQLGSTLELILLCWKYTRPASVIRR